MSIATGVNTCFAEEFVTLQAYEIPNIKPHFLGADGTTCLGRVWGIFQLTEYTIQFDASRFDNVFTYSVEGRVTDAHLQILMLVEVRHLRSCDKGTAVTLEERLKLCERVIWQIYRFLGRDMEELVSRSVFLRLTCEAFRAYFLSRAIFLDTGVTLDGCLAYSGC